MSGLLHRMLRPSLTRRLLLALLAATAVIVLLLSLLIFYDVFVSKDSEYAVARRREVLAVASEFANIHDPARLAEAADLVQRIIRGNSTGQFEEIDEIARTRGASTVTALLLVWDGEGRLVYAPDDAPHGFAAAAVAAQGNTFEFGGEEHYLSRERAGDLTVVLADQLSTRLMHEAVMHFAVLDLIKDVAIAFVVLLVAAWIAIRGGSRVRWRGAVPKTSRRWASPPGMRSCSPW